MTQVVVIYLNTRRDQRMQEIKEYGRHRAEGLVPYLIVYNLYSIDEANDAGSKKRNKSKIRRNDKW